MMLAYCDSVSRSTGRERAEVIYPRAVSIARHTRSAVQGMSMWRTPRCDTASTIALCTAGVDPRVADSPMPLAPSGLCGLGVSVLNTSYDGSSAAEGIA